MPLQKAFTNYSPSNSSIYQQQKNTAKKVCDLSVANQTLSSLNLESSDTKIAQIMLHNSFLFFTLNCPGFVSVACNQRTLSNTRSP